MDQKPICIWCGKKGRVERNGWQGNMFEGNTGELWHFKCYREMGRTRVTKAVTLELFQQGDGWQ